MHEKLAVSKGQRGVHSFTQRAGRALRPHAFRALKSGRGKGGGKPYENQCEERVDESGKHKSFEKITILITLVCYEDFQKEIFCYHVLDNFRLGFISLTALCL